MANTSPVNQREDGKVENLHTTKEVAHVLGVAASTLRQWRMKGEGPPYIRCGGITRYRQADVESWLRSATVVRGRGAA